MKRSHILPLVVAAIGLFAPLPNSTTFVKESHAEGATVIIVCTAVGVGIGGLIQWLCSRPTCENTKATNVGTCNGLCGHLSVSDPTQEKYKCCMKSCLEHHMCASGLDCPEIGYPQANCPAKPPAKGCEWIGYVQAAARPIATTGTYSGFYH